MKILVTGAAGFVGRRLVPLLKQRGHEPVAIVRPGTDTSSLAAHRIPFCIDSGKEPLSGSLSRFAPFDGVVHLASFFVSSHTEAQVAALMESDVLFPARALDAAARLGIRWFVNTGTTWQRFNGAECSPVNLYAAAKQAFESIIRFYQETTRIRFATLALSDTYGPGDTRPKLLNLWRRIAGTPETLKMSAGTQRIELVYVDDVAEAFRLLAESLQNGAPAAPGPYTLDTGRYPTLRELAVIFEKASGRRLSIEWGARPARPREMQAPWHSGLNVPGWKPKTSLEDGIARLCQAIS